ncbi:MAG TPA: hypothetical protein VF846_00210 [Thermoanaerobaculia bacterium]|jgi:hypothetical protein
MSKAQQRDIAAQESAPGEFGPITPEQFQALPDDVKRRRTERILANFNALQGNVHLNIDIDELRGRNRR